MQRCLSILVLLLLSPLTAFAHAHLLSAEATADHTSLKLKFSEAIEPTLAKIEVRDVATKALLNADAKPTVVDPTTLSVALQNVKSGQLEVTWAVTAKDTHKSNGKTVVKIP